MATNHTAETESAIAQARAAAPHTALVVLSGEYEKALDAIFETGIPAHLVHNLDALVTALRETEAAAAKADAEDAHNDYTWYAEQD